MTTNEIISIATQHADNPQPLISSAKLCLADAIALRDTGQEHFARYWAIRSLSYSVGIFHADYRAAVASDSRS